MRAGVRNDVAFARVKKLENAVLVLDLAPSLRGELAHKGGLIRHPGDESALSVDDAHLPVLGYFTSVEQLQKAAHFHSDRKRAKWLVVLEDGHVDVRDPVPRNVADQHD